MEKATRTTAGAIILLAFFAIYLVTLFKITVFKYPNTVFCMLSGESWGARSLNLVPFGTVSEYLQFILSGKVIIGVANILGNLIIFFPLGYIAALLFPKMRKLTRILILAFIFSLAIEVCQYIFACGSADIDDIILNTLGGMVGYWVYILISRYLEPKKNAILISTLIVAFTCSGFYICDYYFKPLPPAPSFQSVVKRINHERIERPFQNIIINSSNAILIQLDKNGNQTLFDKGGEEKIYPASMTKIMTAIVALENIKDLDTKITLNKKIFTDMYNCNSAVAGFLEGETVRAIDLLYGLMLPSGGECSIGLAECVSESERAFVDLMNKKTAQINMINTHFTNSTGLHNQNHYSTANDIAALLEYALKNDTFCKLITTARYSTMPTNRHPDGITFYSTLFSKMDKPDFSGGVILGGKTGYTPEAGQCLASLSEKDGKQFILVTCGAPGDSKTQILHIEDTKKILSSIR